METLQAYKSFNDNKSIEELEFTISSELTNIENFKFELQFFKSLLDKPIFKPHVMNIYENLIKFKNEINILNTACEELVDELNSHAHQIKTKIECDDMACDNFFIKTQDTIDLKVFNFKIKIFNFKFRLFQFLEGVISN
jgi:hypothetical protein